MLTQQNKCTEKKTLLVTKVDGCNVSSNASHQMVDAEQQIPHPPGGVQKLKSRGDRVSSKVPVTSSMSHDNVEDTGKSFLTKHNIETLAICG